MMHKTLPSLALIIVITTVIFISGCINPSQSTIPNTKATPTPTPMNKCGNSSYNLKNESCCLNTVYKGGNWTTCGDTCYNNDTWTCCEGQINYGKNWTSCANGCINTDTQSCCQGHVIDEKGWTTCNDSCCKLETNKFTSLFLLDKESVSMDSQAISPRPTGVSCGYSTCPVGWNCCGDMCYSPIEEPQFKCVNNTLKQNAASRYTCADIDCQGFRCCDTRSGPQCYDPHYFRCGAL